MKTDILLTVVLILIFPCVVQGVLIEDWLIRTLLQDYNELAYPGTTDNETVVVKHDMSLLRIVEFDGTKLTIDTWLGTEWRDPRLCWASSPTNIRLPISKIWTPDIVLYDNPDTRTRFEPNAVVDQSGLVYFSLPIRLEVDNCRQSQDEFKCTFKFGSWTFDGFKIDLQNRSQVIDLSNFQHHNSYEIKDTSVVRNVVYYPCCEEPYPDITYSVYLKRRKTGWFDRL
ncbi:acetylcholine receptor subunit alpha-type acr-16-like [Mytilus californianus]|uniref:acetylcholine receptor subunit alpha-type acr-16-like n=1 Tax=Mytilus californianus TaxID=6549 RepID=UPI002247FB4C|nr:acetylcholine receptor subunit alpha-type acr-16-like [Mytilus californianus]